MREDECYNCVHLKEDHRYGQDDPTGEDCLVEDCDCREWEPFPTPTDEPD